MSKSLNFQWIFDEEFGLLRHTTHRAFAKNKLAKMRIAGKHCHPRFLLDFVPFFKWFPRYNIKENLMNDIIGGLTVGIMHVPQGMAYSSLAGAQPVNGLYTSLFPALFYMLFGTSRHVSLGVFAVVSLMSGSCNQRVSSILESKAGNGTMLDAIDEETRMQTSMAILTSLTLCVGIIQIAMALLRLDFLTALLSDQIIAGFTTGASVHVFTAQLNKILGVPLPRHSGAGKLFFMYKDLISSIFAGYANWFTFALSMGTIITLFLVKSYVDPLVKKRCRLPIPYDLFVMIIGTVVSYAVNLNARGTTTFFFEKTACRIPSPSVPDVSLFGYLIGDALAIAVVSLVITVSMGKLFAKKHNYEIDVRQEFYAMGFMESFCSLFPIWPASTALARTLVYEASGTKTQLATVFSSLLLLAVIFFIGPFIEVLPVCFLSCIIIVALRGMFVQLNAIKTLWPISKADCMIFIVSFAATVLYDVVEGLMIGVVFAAAVLVFGILNAKVVEIGRLSHNEGQTYFQPIEKYRDAAISDGVCCVRFSSPLVYINVEHFKKGVEQVVRLPALERRRMEDQKERELTLKNSRKDTTATLRSVKIIPPDTLEKKYSLVEVKHEPIRAIIIDLSTVPYVDVTGANCLIEIIKDQRTKGVNVLCAAAPLEVLERLQNVLGSEDIEMLSRFYPSIEDALNNVDPEPVAKDCA
ncbi:sulfate permease [Oesophagostomum dentatum]|uniref:Sulfate permease n=1 Tax=Oesophagostomum dentatum TaxID=61180 RepID=A0A0B1TG50_OESDE|nr:sulfate permease [Oesophagostomum dentatum]